MINMPAIGFYLKLGFRELLRAGEGKDGCIYMGKPLAGSANRKSQSARREAGGL
jgi:hypothetical protein